MAVAGLHNVSVLDPSFHRESRSPVSRQWSNQYRPSSSTRASSLLQMWRELESERVVSHPQARFGERLREHTSDGMNVEYAGTYSSEGQGSDSEDTLENANEVENECGTCSQGQMGSHNEHEVGEHSSSEQSTDFAEVERERVGQIFRKWRNSGIRGHTPNVSHMNNRSRAQWLGENECERVRIVREWVQRTTQQRNFFGGRGEEQDAEIGPQIEQVRDGLVINNCEISSRRAIRKLCGRQALLDLLMKAERERKRELQGLLEHRPVSDFSHRNRIQSLLRGRFLRNGRSIQDEIPTSLAATELGLLRQRNTVSGLREGFLSRSDNFHGPITSAQYDASSNNVNNHRDEQSPGNNFGEVLDENPDQSEPANEEREYRFQTDDVVSHTDGSISQRELTAQAEETQEEVLESEEIVQQRPSNIECVRRDDSGSDVVVNWQGSIADGSSEETSDSGTNHLQGAHEVVFQEQHEPISEESDDHSVSHNDGLEGNTVEEFDGQETSAQVVEWQDSSIENDEITSVQVEEWQESSLENEESDWQQVANVEFNEWIGSTAEDIDGDWQENTSGQWYPEISGNDDEEQSHRQESPEERHENGLEDALDNWLDGPSSQEAGPIGRVDAFFSSDDDNIYSMELRELLGRRRVSNLLRSGFRESLDHLIQSYVERQAHASADWELDGSLLSPALVEQDQEQQSGNQDASQPDAVERSPLLASPSVTPSQSLWNQELHDANWPPHNSHQRLRIEWEIINELRIDMARLQHKMNDIQRMLEACMDMQLELQRSVLQEVSAALNRSDGSTDASENSLPSNESKWDHVRKGICCICCDNNIDSLLYRCGHMCSCSKCADKIVQGRGKCPMCRAPVVEVIRAYSIQ